ncbi:Golgi apparatus membrane protein TVP38 [Rhodofomes roseus]|uniref:Golgi apparatus membrane protein TVP38 n=1 Tax=Rhodofomes roseus TaxID=34475 RepID=A0ABQ8KYC7_9APHY|nr:Golgi apparatus membrane protein TVP38 [Rhodofomes roseus]KAH9843895.1 Golgi apparatus membrane protein TVP38 [Rhodofomes roseus]
MAPQSGYSVSWALAAFKHYGYAAFRRYRQLGIRGKIFLLCSLAIYIAIPTTFIVVGPGRIGQALYDLAQKISHLWYGSLILLSVLVVISFPPCIGHSTVCTLCGFAYGLKGFPLAAGGSLLGSALCFTVLRFLFSRKLHQWSASNEKWQALEIVVDAKGLPLITLIRASPFPPWVYSNALFASIRAVALWQFCIATFATFPKVALLVFVGSRLAALSDGETRNHMDTSTKWLNVGLSVGGLLLGMTASVIVYRAMQAEIRRLQGVSPDVEELAAEAIEEAVEDAEEGAPLLGHPR